MASEPDSLPNDMTAWAAMHAVAAVSGLIVIALALLQKAHSPLLRPLALLGADQFAWNAAAAGSELTHQDTFAVLSALAAPFFTPLAFDFVLCFVGKRTRFRLLLRSAYGLAFLQTVFAALSATVLTRHSDDLLALGLLLVGVPYALAAMVLVVRHFRRSNTPLERLRSTLLLVALTVVLSCLTTDPLADLGLAVPHLATVGSFFFNAILTHLTLVLRLLEPYGKRRLALGQAVVMALLFSVGSLALFNSFGDNQGALVVAVLAISLTVAVLTWLYLIRSSAVRTSLERFATLGRFSAQMAHDLKNPLAAAKGAAEYLQEELRRASLDSTRDFAALLVSQLGRLEIVIDRYQRLSKLEPQLTLININQLVQRVTSLQRFAANAAVEVNLALVTPGPTIRADGDLLASALENLVKNALEAMPEGGTLAVSTEVSREDDDDGQLRISVKDTGMGLNARAQEQAFELFFTTKASGSGLGLAFVREVAHAHGGEALLSSREGQGTTVTLELPLVF